MYNIDTFFEYYLLTCLYCSLYDMQSGNTILNDSAYNSDNSILPFFLSRISDAIPLFWRNHISYFLYETTNSDKFLQY